MKRGEGCEIEARGLNYKPDSRARHVLLDVSCLAKPWELLAVVGPSGAGKSSLLEILAGHRLPDCHPSVFVGGRPVDDFSAHKKLAGFVSQKDALYPLLTVRETLAFAAALRLGTAAAAARVDALLLELGLAHVADRRVGDGVRVTGISGGERRRVSIGVDVVHDPRILILDEPTSGLDSTSALQVVDLLKSMAETRGRTVVLSIHQPGFRIVKLFNSLLLLANGTVLHHGTVDQLHCHLTSIGLQIPSKVNVVEFAIDSIESLQLQHRHHDDDSHSASSNLTHKQTQSLLLEDIKRDRCTLQMLFHQHKVVDEESSTYVSSDGKNRRPYNRYANSWIVETMILAHRFFKNVARTKELFLCRTVQMLVSGLVLGSIFYNLHDDRVGAGERVGLFAFVLTFLLSSTTEALPIFLKEREILMRETSNGSYRVSSYVVANGLVFAPFLLALSFMFSGPMYWLVGLNRCFAAFAYFLMMTWMVLYIANSVVVCFSALVPNFVIGNSVISGVMGSFFLFSGYFISKKAMPRYWVFMHYVSLFKYPFEGFLMNEFAGEGRCLEYRMGVCVLMGEDILREEGFEAEGRWRNVGVMVCFILVYRFFSYLILRCRCRCAQMGGIKRSLL